MGITWNDCNSSKINCGRPLFHGRVKPRECLSGAATKCFKEQLLRSIKLHKAHYYYIIELIVLGSPEECLIWQIDPHLDQLLATFTLASLIKSAVNVDGE